MTDAKETFTMDSIIFDLDGTLWNSTDIVVESWNQVLDDIFDNWPALTSNDLKSLFGRTLPDIAAMIFPDIPPEKQLELIELCCIREHEALLEHNPPLFAGVPDTLAVLAQKYPLFIVSNCEAGYIELFLSVTGLGKYFRDHLCPGDTGNAKASNIKEIIQRNSLKSPIYIGDTLGDHNAAREADIPFVFASYGFGSVENPEYMISSPTDLLQLFNLQVSPPLLSEGDCKY